MATSNVTGQWSDRFKSLSSCLISQDSDFSNRSFEIYSVRQHRDFLLVYQTYRHSRWKNPISMHQISSWNGCWARLATPYLGEAKNRLTCILHLLGVNAARHPPAWVLLSLADAQCHPSRLSLPLISRSSYSKSPGLYYRCLMNGLAARIVQEGSTQPFLLIIQLKSPAHITGLVSWRLLRCLFKASFHFFLRSIV